MTKQGSPEQAALPQDLVDFLLELAIALSRSAMYPPGHPSMATASAGVMTRLDNLLEERSQLSVGVASRQLVIEGLATDPEQPVLKALAERLHRHQMGAIMFLKGVDRRQLEEFLHALAREADAVEELPAGADPARLGRWQGIRAFPMTYEKLELVGGGDGDGTGEAFAPGTEHQQSALLWMGLARAATATGPDEDLAATDAGAVAEAINEHEETEAYDQVIVGYLLQLAEELKEDADPATQAVRNRMSRMLASLDDKTLLRLVEMGGSMEQRQEFLLNATEGLNIEAVLEVVRAAAHASGQTISQSMVRMLAKLGAASDGSGPTAKTADAELRDQIRQLISDWHLEDPNPDAYTRALDAISRTSERDLARAGGRHLPEPLRLLQMGLEVDAVGIPFWRAVESLLAEGQLMPVVHALLDAPPSDASTALWGRLARPDTLRTLLELDDADFIALEKVLDRMEPEEAAPLLLDRLAESENRTFRMAIFQRLAKSGPTLLPMLARRADDSRWYVTRNMLALMNEMKTVAPGFDPEKYLKHPQTQVRREAIALCFRVPDLRERTFVRAMQEGDERVLRLAVAEGAAAQPPRAVVAPLCARLEDEALEDDLRAGLTRLLRGQRTPQVPVMLQRLLSGGRSLLGRPRLAAKSATLLAALEVGAADWRRHSQIKPFLDAAAKSSDGQIRNAAGGSGA
ncbi:MAG: hypothetical protein WEB88_01710 [Gemmatimonadota bacterium]